MARLNKAPVIEHETTHGGARAAMHVSPSQQLWRAVGASLLFEPTFYEPKNEAAGRIVGLVKQVDDATVAEIAVTARTNLKLRSTPLWVVASLIAKHAGGTPPPGLIADTIERVVRRPDELAELVTMYWTLNGRKPIGATGHSKLTKQMKRGLARAFVKFDAYQLEKWNRDRAVKLRDVLFLAHAKPTNEVQQTMWAKLVAGQLDPPDTWEVQLSAGADKRETWTRLISTRKLGYVALLMNLRNALAAGVDLNLLKDAILSGAAKNVVLPFRFVAAAKAAPKLEAVLDQAMTISTSNLRRLPGKTLLVIDVSGSMAGSLSAKSTLDRVDAAGALAVLAREICEDVSIYATAGNDWNRKHDTAELPARRGMALIEALQSAKIRLGGGGIFLKQCMDYIAEHEPGVSFDRVLVFTDEQDCDTKANPSTAKKLGGYNYIMNVANYTRGIATDGGWERISGFSEHVLDWIAFNEFGAPLSQDAQSVEPDPQETVESD